MVVTSRLFGRATQLQVPGPPELKKSAGHFCQLAPENLLQSVTMSGFWPFLASGKSSPVQAGQHHVKSSRQPLGQGFAIKPGTVNE